MDGEAGNKTLSVCRDDWRPATESNPMSGHECNCCLIGKWPTAVNDLLTGGFCNKLGLINSQMPGGADKSFAAPGKIKQKSVGTITFWLVINRFHCDNAQFQLRAQSQMWKKIAGLLLILSWFYNWMCLDCVLWPPAPVDFGLLCFSPLPPPYSSWDDSVS